MRNDNLVKTIEVKDRAGRVIGTKEVVLYEGLLNRAHDEGLKRIWTRLLQVPTEDNQMTAIVIAKVETDRGIFSGLGDASPLNVDTMIAPHIIRMAETRAKARALRDAVNIGVVALEELSGEMDGELSPDLQPSPETKDQADSSKKHRETKEPRMSEAQRRYLFRLLASQGIKGEAAHSYLREVFHTDSLKKVTKAQAGKLIEELLEETQGEPVAGSSKH